MKSKKEKEAEEIAKIKDRFKNRSTESLLKNLNIGLTTNILHRKAINEILRERGHTK
ncbi:MAG: hypothetical protein ABUT20_26135 [Bacteroidota bacterium]